MKKTVHVGHRGKASYNVHITEEGRSFRIVRENLTQLQAYRAALALANDSLAVEREWHMHAERDISLEAL